MRAARPWTIALPEAIGRNVSPIIGVGLASAGGADRLCQACAHMRSWSLTRKFRDIAVASALVLLSGGNLHDAALAFGAECIGITAPDSVKVGGSDLVLNGMGIRKATMLQVNVYVGSFYLPEKSKDASHILDTDQPWQLVLRFVRDVDVSDIRDALEEGFAKAAGNKLAALSPRIETLNAGRADVKEGQYLSFTYDPTKGVAVDVNGAGGPTIQGSEFSLALLSIWIGTEPRDAGLKAGLLGGECE
jgi:hypothetical protein